MGIDLVVSGFEAFGAHACNATADAVRALAREGRFADRVAFVVLPVTYTGAARVLLARLAYEQARGCLAFGIAGDADELRVERCAHNAMDAEIADNAGALHAGTPVVPGGPAVLTTRGPAEAVRDALAAAGATAALSDDPGRFVCNATYYRVLAAADACAPLFVHVPAAAAPAAVQAWMAVAIAAYLAAMA